MTGLLPVLLLATSANRGTLVLTFHDMIERRDSKALWFDCTTKELTDQLNWLTAQGAHFVTLDALYGHLASKTPLPPNPVALTFADNYEGFYLRALPLLRSRHIPAAMFVHTGFVGSAIGRPKMTWSQLKELDREGLITIGSQTVTHRSLADLDGPSILKELVESKRDLERHLGHPVRFLAYPNGSFNETAAKSAKLAGYRMGFTERLFPAERMPNLFEVPRYVHTKYRQGWRDARAGR